MASEQVAQSFSLSFRSAGVRQRAVESECTAHEVHAEVIRSQARSAADGHLDLSEGLKDSSVVVTMKESRPYAIRHQGVQLTARQPACVSKRCERLPIGEPATATRHENPLGALLRIRGDQAFAIKPGPRLGDGTKNLRAMIANCTVQLVDVVVAIKGLVFAPVGTLVQVLKDEARELLRLKPQEYLRLVSELTNRHSRGLNSSSSNAAVHLRRRPGVG